MTQLLSECEKIAKLAYTITYPISVDIYPILTNTILTNTIKYNF